MKTSAQPTSVDLELLVAQASDEFLERIERGEFPDIEEYAQRFPDAAPVLRKMLPALQALRAPSCDGDDQSLLSVLKGVRQIGDFQLVREIGRGGMGIVYEARQVSLGRPVALKVLPLAAALDDKQLQRFKNEAHAAANLQHANIVPVYSIGSEGGVHFYAMRLIEGHTVATLIRELRLLEGLDTDENLSSSIPDAAKSQQGQLRRNADDDLARTAVSGQAAAVHSDVSTQALAALSTENSSRSSGYLRRVAEIGHQAAKALEHAHQCGVIHRDIKPANLLIDMSGNLWITDFGLAHLQTDCGLTLTGDILGTIRYMSPEQAEGRRMGVDRRTDVYSLGATLYELLTLERAFAAADRRELLHSVLTDEPRPLRRISRHIPEDLETIVLKAMAKHPTERYATAQEMADDLQRFLGDQPILARRPTLTQRATKWTRRHRPLVWTAAAALVLISCASLTGAVLVGQQRDEARRAADLAKQEQARADEERARAERNFQIARDAVDRIFTRVAEDLGGVPHMEHIRRALLEDALEFYQGFLSDRGDDPSVRHEAALAYLRVGKTYSLLGRYEDAGVPLKQAIDLFQQLITEQPENRQYRDELSAAYQQLGYSLLWAQGNDAVLAVRRERLKLSEQLHRSYPAEARYISDLAYDHAAIGIQFRAMGRSDEALNDLEQALAYYEKRTRDFPDQPQDLWLVSHIQHWLGATLADLRRFDEAERAYQTSHELRKQMLAADPRNAEIRQLLEHVKAYWAMLLWRHAKPAEALQRVQEAVEIAEELLRDFPNVADYRRRAAHDYEILGRILFGMRRTEEAEAALRRVIEIREKSAKEGVGPRSLQKDLALGHFNLGVLLESTGRSTEAAEQFRQALEILNAQVSQRPEDPNLNYNLARVLAACPAVQFQDAPRAVQAARQALQHEPEAARHWEVLGIAQYRAGDWAAAIESLDKTLKLVGGADESTHYSFLAMAHWRLGRQKEARDWYDKSANWIDTNQPCDEQHHRFHSEAADLLGVRQENREILRLQDPRPNVDTTP